MTRVDIADMDVQSTFSHGVELKLVLSVTACSDFPTSKGVWPLVVSILCQERDLLADFLLRSTVAPYIDDALATKAAISA